MAAVPGLYRLPALGQRPPLPHRSTSARATKVRRQSPAARGSPGPVRSPDAARRPAAGACSQADEGRKWLISGVVAGAAAIVAQHQPPLRRGRRHRHQAHPGAPATSSPDAPRRDAPTQRLARHGQHHGGALVHPGRRRRHRYASGPALRSAKHCNNLQFRPQAVVVHAGVAHLGDGRAHLRQAAGGQGFRCPASSASSCSRLQRGPALRIGRICVSKRHQRMRQRVMQPRARRGARASRRHGMAAWRASCASRSMRAVRAPPRASSSVLSWVRRRLLVLPMPVIGHQAWNAR